MYSAIEIKYFDLINKYLDLKLILNTANWTQIFWKRKAGSNQGNKD